MHVSKPRWLLLAGCLGVLWSPGPLVAQVRLNEILADPAMDWDGDSIVNSRDDEWVEIINTGVAPVDLEGYRIASADSVWRFAFSGTLDPGEVRVVFGSESLAWEQATGNPQYGLRLANGGGTVTLWHLAAPETILVEAYTYQDHEADDDRSSGRFPDGGDTWFVFDALNPYTGSGEPGGNGCAPSPGAMTNCPTPAKSETWGGLKLRYTMAP